MISRRQFVRLNAITCAGLVLPWRVLTPFALASEESLLDAEHHPKFVNPLPEPFRIDATQGASLRVAMQETEQSLGLVDPFGHPLMTRVWGYNFPGLPTTYPGATIVAHRDQPLTVRWENQLAEAAPGEAHLLPVDTSIHLAVPERLPKQGIPLVTHVHGGHTESASDGLPEAWFTRNFKETGPTFVKRRYHYDNDQEAATLWYHDHALGITRLNVYAGLAGFYLLRDDNENQLIAGGILPGGPYEKEIVIQDRMFTENGQLFIPVEDEELPEGSPFPSIIAEFFGDFILVNGAAWPYLDVEPRKYRFRLLNGSDSRFYVLQLTDRFGDPRTFFQIGTDDGLLPFPVPLEQLVIAPGERCDLVLDFAGLETEELVLRNFGPDEPFKGFDPDDPPADPETTGQIMQFRVNQPLSGEPDSLVDLNTRLRDDIVPLVATVPEPRKVVLFEGEDQYGRLRPQLGILDPASPLNGSLLWDEPITENPQLNDVEVWEVYNATEDAHPIHLHMVTFQIINRQRFKGKLETVGPDPLVGGTKQVLTKVKTVGQPQPPPANERGWKDTAQMLPGQVTRVIAKFDRSGRYVWHCHILSHEDHEMMRPFFVG